MTNYIHYPTKELREDIRYLQLLARSFPTLAAASSEIINLDAILNLPKGTEHFLSDVHGEYEAFQHVLKNASGTIKRKVNEIFENSLRESEKKDLCTLIYYPDEKLKLVKESETDMAEWYEITLNRLVKVAQSVSSKYTRSKVNKALPKDFSYIIQELLHESESDANKHAYFRQIISTIIYTRRADAFIIAMCELIQRLAIDCLHIIGDIFDRGPGAHIIMDTLCDYHRFDIQWGNHDVLWMGAYAGNDACIANVIRISLRYGNLDTIEEGYGVNLLPLATYAMETYRNTDLSHYMPLLKYSANDFSSRETQAMALMHKAISVMQWKLEGQIIQRNPDYGMDDRLLLGRIDTQRGTVNVDGVEYTLRDTDFPTVNPDDPYRLTTEEANIMAALHNTFGTSEKMNKHMSALIRHGSLYLAHNNNLMFHASIPLNADGSFRKVRIAGEDYAGKALYDRLDTLIQTACRRADDEPDSEYAVDYMWYLWCGPDSPLFDKSKMATFESYLIDDPEAHKEKKGNYYLLNNDEEICDRILAEFNVTGESAHIINGHVPVRTTKGENPIKANGKLLVIDGGFSKAYQPKTGIAGYTLVYHSRGLQLVQHNPFESRQKAILEGQDIISNTVLNEYSAHRLMVRDTDKGRELAQQVEDLNKLLAAYRRGLIKENK
ncbi:MAG: fructose-1,6-bisphosphatase [Muribaculaceae bacterium]|nr:fructose-1,6-bisphosphatase [Muribaculaceae bacterium]